MSVTGYAGMVNLQGLAVRVEPPAETFAGTAAPFTITVKNSKRRLPSFLLLLTMPDRRETVAKIPLVEPGSEASATARLLFPTRGRATVRQVRVSSPFPVAFFYRYWNFPVQRQIVVFPQLVPCTLDTPDSGKGKNGDLNRYTRGVDGELEGIAGYSGNEPMKKIHWKLSARSGTLLVKEFGSLAAEPLLIDLREIAAPDPEKRISGAAWLVRQWVENRPVGLKAGSVFIPPACGRRHGARLLTELALLGTTAEPSA